MVFGLSFKKIGLTFKKARPYNPFLGCSHGFRKQHGYTRKDGKRIPTRCVHGESAPDKKKTHGGRLFFQSSVTRRKCPSGYVYRKGYTRKFHTKTREKGYSVQKKDGTRYRIFPKTVKATVKSSCMRKKRASTASSSVSAAKCASLKRGELYKFGYQYRLATAARRDALKKAIQTYTPLGVYKRLKLASKCSKSIKPTASKIFEEDASQIRSNYAIESLIKK
jgi:hypothetical protein